MTDQTQEAFDLLREASIVISPSDGKVEKCLACEISTDVSDGGALVHNQGCIAIRIFNYLVKHKALYKLDITFKSDDLHWAE